MKPTTLEDVAREAGVSRALVSIAYRGAEGVSDITRARIFEAGRTLGYRPNRIAARLASKATDTIGVFLQDMHNDVFADIYDGIREVADDGGKHLVLAVGTPDGRMDDRSIETLLQSRVDVVLGAGLLLSDEAVRRYSRVVSIVSVARDLPGVDSVYSNNFLGATAATEYLLELGHTRVMFLANPQTDGYLDRQRGFEDTMSRAGIAAQVLPSRYSRSGAAEDIGALLDSPQRPTAVFAHNDQAAFGVLDAMALRGLRAPQDVSVVGYDNSSVSRAPGTMLTTIDIHGVELGRQAAHAAMRRLNEESSPRIASVSTPSLVIGATTGKPPNGSGERGH